MPERDIESLGVMGLAGGVGKWFHHRHHQGEFWSSSGPGSIGPNLGPFLLGPRVFSQNQVGFLENRIKHTNNTKLAELANNKLRWGGLDSGDRSVSKSLYGRCKRVFVGFI